MASCEEILAVPGLAFAEMGPGDLSLSLGYLQMPRDPYPPRWPRPGSGSSPPARKNGVAFLSGANAETIGARIDEGVRVISGQREETARAGRAHSRRTMPALQLRLRLSGAGGCSQEETFPLDGCTEGAGSGVKERSGMESAERQRRSRRGALAAGLGLGLAGTAAALGGLSGCGPGSPGRWPLCPGRRDGRRRRRGHP